MTYQIKTNIIENGVKSKVIIIKPDGKFLTYAEFIKLLKSQDEELLKTLTGALKTATNELKSAFFWECLPVSKNSLNKIFAFVVNKSVELNKITQNYSNFQEHFKNNNDVVSFPNQGRNATLITPIPKTGKDYKNLSEFTKNAPQEQQEYFWKEVGDKMSESLKNSGTTKWLSTSGLGVHYLHVRIDNRPKYYTHAEYNNKDFEEKVDTPTPPPNPKLDTIIKNLQTAIASGEKNQLVSSIAEGRKYEEESNSSELSQLLEQAQKKLGSLDQKAWKESILSNFQSKMALNSVKPDQLSSEAQAAQTELTNKENLTEDRVEEINTLVINNIGETSLTNLISKIKQALTTATPQQLKKFQQELTKFQVSTVSYKKHAYQKNQSEVDQLIVQLAEKERQKQNTSTPFWRQPKVVIPLALVSLLVLLIIVIISSNRKRG